MLELFFITKVEVEKSRSLGQEPTAYNDPIFDVFYNNRKPYENNLVSLTIKDLTGIFGEGVVNIAVREAQERFGFNLQDY